MKLSATNTCKDNNITECLGNKLGPIIKSLLTLFSLNVTVKFIVQSILISSLMTKMFIKYRYTYFIKASKICII